MDCMIHGLTDKTMRSSANALCCSQLEQVLNFLMTNKEVLPFAHNDFRNRPPPETPAINYSKNKAFRATDSHNSELYCYNCKNKGHPYYKCTKPLLKCTRCNRFGHKIDTCFTKRETDHKSGSVSKTMSIVSSGSSSKYIKEIRVNNKPTKSFIDFGSEVTLMNRTLAFSLGLTFDYPPTSIKGFGNNIMTSIGGVKVVLSVDDVSADVVCHVVEDKFLELPVLIGQSFTEQDHVVVYKDAMELRFWNTNNEMLLPQFHSIEDVSVSITVFADVSVYGPAAIKARTS